MNDPHMLPAGGPTDFQLRATSTALDSMFRKQWFDITILDNVAKVLGRHVGGKDYDALRAVHCVNYADMHPDLRRMVRTKVLELLGVPPDIIDVDVEQPSAPQAQPESGRRWLSFFGSRK